MATLDELRREVRDINGEILQLIRKRLEITEKIGKEKKKKGIPLKNWEVEKEVIEDAEKTARRIGLSSSLAKRIMQPLIEESCIQQEKLHYSACAENKEHILMIGGAGGMGTWFSSFFQNQGHDVLIYDTKGDIGPFKSVSSLEKGLPLATCIFIATPIDTISEVIQQLIHLNYPGLVVDISSVKGHLTETFKKAVKAGLCLTSIHPMFGPQAQTLSDKVLCICDCGNDKANKKAEGFFKSTALRLVRFSLGEHDQMISYILGLSHFLNILFMKILSESPFSLSRLEQLVSPTFLSQLQTAVKVIYEDPSLYYAIQSFNPFKDTLYQDIRRDADDLIKCVEQNQRDKFIGIVEKCRDWLHQS